MTEVQRTEEGEEPSPVDEITLQLDILSQIKQELQSTPSAEPGVQDALAKVETMEVYLQQALTEAKSADEELTQFATRVVDYLGLDDQVEQKRRAAELQQSLTKCARKYQPLTARIASV